MVRKQISAKDYVPIIQDQEYIDLVARITKDFASLVEYEIKDLNKRDLAKRNEYMRKYLAKKLEADPNYKKPVRECQQPSEKYRLNNKDKISRKRKETFCSRYENGILEIKDSVTKRYNRYKEELKEAGVTSSRPVAVDSEINNSCNK